MYKSWGANISDSGGPYPAVGAPVFGNSRNRVCGNYYPGWGFHAFFCINEKIFPVLGRLLIVGTLYVSGCQLLIFWYAFYILSAKTNKPFPMKTFYVTALKATFALMIAILFAGLNKATAQQNASSTNNLPALLMSFTGTTNSNAAQLTWVMENETNCKWFVIERAGQSGGFDSINVVAGVNNDHTTNYNFEDEQMLNGTNYYRLRQVDRDGVVKYSAVISLYNISASSKMSIFPNPAAAVINYAVTSTSADVVTVQVYNLAG